MSQMTASKSAAKPGRLSHALRIGAAAMAVIGLGLTGYLAMISFVGGVEPVGCGATSGCAGVLGSQWSRVLGVPVGLPAMGVYLVMLAGLVTVGRPAGRWLVTLAAAAVVAAAGWFVFLQFVWLGTWCVYCMAGHGAGVVAAVLGLAVVGSRGVMRPGAMGAAVAVGLAAVTVLAGVQLLTSEPVHRIAVLDVEWAPAEEPVLGLADAERFVLVMVDYACPHCRHTHGVLLEAQAELDPAPTLVVLPVPLNPACNPHAPQYPGPRFAESCELARLALAVHLADPAAFAAFDHWLFEPELPRSAEAARAEAVTRVGEAALAQALADPRVDERLARNTAAFGRSEAGRLPVTLVPGSKPVVGRIEQVSTVHALFEPDEP
ncbi:MAG: vitamin K epoxide reductase family protein [Phycisphaeraceae bacterium]